MNTVTHPIAAEEIMALLDGELPAERAAEIATHLDGCPPCAGVANAMRSSTQSLTNWTVGAAPMNGPWEGSLFEKARQVTSDRRTRVFSLATRVGTIAGNRWLIAACAGAISVALVLALGSGYSLHEVGGGGGVAPVSSSNDQVANQQGQTYRRIEPSPTPSAKAQLYVGGSAGQLAAEYSRIGAALNTARVSESLEKEQPEDGDDTVPRFEPSGPMIARTVSLSVVVKDFSASRSALDAIVARHHGYAASLTASTQPDSARSLQASLRVPAAELAATVAELKALGQVQNETQNGEEVTQQHADLVARLKNSRETERRLQAILEQRTGKIADILAVEQEIARVRGEIEGMEAEQKSLEHRVSFASVDLNLAEEYKATINQTSPRISTRVHNGIVAGYQDAVETLIGIVLFFAVHGPTLLIWLAFLAPVVWLVRRRWLRASAVAGAM